MFSYTESRCKVLLTVEEMCHVLLYWVPLYNFTQQSGKWFNFSFSEFHCITSPTVGERFNVLLYRKPLYSFTNSWGKASKSPDRVSFYNFTDSRGKVSCSPLQSALVNFAISGVKVRLYITECHCTASLTVEERYYCLLYRVPLYNFTNRRGKVSGLPEFLKHNFAGNARWGYILKSYKIQIIKSK